MAIHFSVKNEKLLTENCWLLFPLAHLRTIGSVFAFILRCFVYIVFIPCLCSFLQGVAGASDPMLIFGEWTKLFPSIFQSLEAPVDRVAHLIHIQRARLRMSGNILRFRALIYKLDSAAAKGNQPSTKWKFCSELLQKRGVLTLDQRAIKTMPIRRLVCALFFVFWWVTPYKIGGGWM